MRKRHGVRLVGLGPNQSSPHEALGGRGIEVHHVETLLSVQQQSHIKPVGASGLQEKPNPPSGPLLDVLHELGSTLRIVCERGCGVAPMHGDHQVLTTHVDPDTGRTTRHHLSPG